MLIDADAIKKKNSASQYANSIGIRMLPFHYLFSDRCDTVCFIISTCLVGAQSVDMNLNKYHLA
jgi:hypothetical protein